MYIEKGTGVLVLKIKNKILTKIKQNEKLSRYNIEVEVNEDKVVFLKGEVDSWDQVVEIGHIAGKTKGVYGVVNDIEVKGANVLKKDKKKLIEKGRKIGVVDEADVIIIGGGVTGCAIARELSKYKLNIVLLEKHEDVAEGASKANNGMIHPGNAAYPGTLKAKLNVKGNAMYTKWAEELGFEFKRTGSIILANSKEDMKIVRLASIAGKLNRVPHMKKLKGEEVMKMEPNIKKKPLMGLYTPTTAYVDGFGVVIALAENAATNGVKFHLNTEVVDVMTDNGKVAGVITDKGIFKGKYVINCAGIYADDIAEMAGDKFFTLHPRRGTILIFDKNKAGVTRSSGLVNSKRNKESKGGGPQQTPEGNQLWGPSATEIMDKEDLTVTKVEFDYAFESGARVEEHISRRDVITYFSGIRPADYKEDFIIGMSKKVKGFINVAGIQSPGLASAPAIAEMVENIVLKDAGGIEKNPDYNPIRKPPVQFRKLSFGEQDKLIKENPLYGHVVCRCETITEAEIVEAIHSPIPATTVDAIKRRTRASMGRCQGGFCGPKIVKILARELGVDVTEITQKGKGSYIIESKSR